MDAGDESPAYQPVPFNYGRDLFNLPSGKKILRWRTKIGIKLRPK
jgi:hypothetical protein